MSEKVYSVYSLRELPHQTSKVLQPFELTGSSVKRANPPTPNSNGNW